MTTLNVRFKLPVYKVSLAEKFLALKKKKKTHTASSISITH